MRLVLYTGKGGVGKTTTAASAAAFAAAKSKRGTKTLVVSADAAHSLGDVLNVRVGPEIRRVAARLYALELDVRVETARHWEKIQDYLVTLFRHQGVEAVVAEELAMLPGAEEVVTLLAVERIARSGDYDLIIVDCAPTDAALRIATLPDVTRQMASVVIPILQTLSGVALPLAAQWLPFPLPDGSVFEQAEELLSKRFGALQKMLTAAETSVRIVVTPERMVIDEARRLFTELTLFEIGCDAVVINRLLPAELGDEPFFRDWVALQSERVAEVEAAFSPLPVLRAPLAEDEVIGVKSLAEHGSRLFETHAPGDQAPTAPFVRFERDDSGYRVVVPLPLAEPSGLDVMKIGDDLVVTVASRRRSIRLPRRLAPLTVRDAKLRDGELVVRLVRAADDAESECE